MSENTAEAAEPAKKGLMAKFLDFVERAGNRLPDPITLFVIMAVGVIIVSALLALIGVGAKHPSSGAFVEVQSLLSRENVRRMFTDMVHNFASFPPLGLVLVTIIGIGVAERSGYINAALRRLVTSVPNSLLTATLVFAGIMSNMAADAGYVVLTPLGAMLFAAIGRHPIAGLAAAFAGVSGGFSANLIITALDPLLSGISTEAASIMQEGYVVQATANYYFMLASTFVITILGTWVTDKIVEPRLGPWEPPAGWKSDTSFGDLSNDEKRGLKITNWTFIVLCALTALLVIPENAPLRSDEHGLRPFYESLVPIIMLLFLICGIVYGVITKSIKNDKDVAGMTGDSMATMGGYIVLAFVAAQFVAYFKWSNLGLVFAISGADFLQAIGFEGIPLMIGFILVTGVVNIFIGSASAKWAIMGPVFVPMFMLMGYSPELVQNTYRIGDSVTNIISPLLPYFPIIIAFAQKYSPKSGIGTLVATMLPYSIVFMIFWTLMLAVWMLLGIPLGPDAPIFIEVPQ